MNLEGITWTQKSHSLAGLNSSCAIHSAEHGQAAAISEPIFSLLPVQVYVPREG